MSILCTAILYDARDIIAKCNYLIASGAANSIRRVEESFALKLGDGAVEAKRIWLNTHFSVKASPMHCSL